MPTGAAPFQNASFDDVDRAFAYQGLLGLAWDISPNWSMDLTGRYLATKDLSWGSVTQNVGPGVGSITDVGAFDGTALADGPRRSRRRRCCRRPRLRPRRPRLRPRRPR